MCIRDRILERVLSKDELELFEEISDEPIDLGEILNDIAGLLLRDRLSILGAVSYTHLDVYKRQVLH